MHEKIPVLCAFECPHADFPPAETAGICRTMSAVWCGKLEQLVTKNVPCEWRKRSGEAGKPTPRGKPAPRGKPKRKRR